MTRITQHASYNALWGRITQHLIFWLGLALLAGLFYLAVSKWGYGFVGFPLDDAWIHQTYARNLAHSGQLAFTPGVPSAGSTAPLWTLLLSVGYLLGLPFKIWTYGLGIALLGLTGWTVARLGRQLFPKQRAVGLWAGLFCLFEWHLVWAAVSGMETILFIWLSLFLFERYLAAPLKITPRSGAGGLGGSTPHFHSYSALIVPFGYWVSLLSRRDGRTPQKQSWQWDFGLGLLGGLLVLTRPEGVGLIGLIGLDIAFRWWRHKHPAVSLWRRWLFIGAGVGVMLTPYVAFHLYLTGLPFPNTLYAKQAEYGAALSTFPLWWRLFGNFGPPVETVQGVFRVIFIGAQALLLPGLIVAGWLTLKERRFALLPAWLWWTSYLLLYGVRLPVTYQHGRYQIPTIAWVVLLGVWGTARLVEWLAGRALPGRVLGRALVLSLGVLVLAFTVIGAQAYGRDVRFIESEMVATAKWLNTQTEPDALIAAHDIGAIGYFTQRPLIDLAGLVTPQVIPIIRDEAALFDFMLKHKADYLVTFPSWYPQITQNPKLTERYRTQAPWAPQAGGDNMAVYQMAAPAAPQN